MTTYLKAAVPTTTILAQNPRNPWEIAVFRSTGKHGNKLVIPGGRLRLGKQNHLQTAIAELWEELKMKILNPQFFCISDKPDRDIRTITIDRFADSNPFPTRLKGMLVEGHYCFDVSVYGFADGEPTADGKEGKSAFWYDLRKLDKNEFALDHGTLALLFKHFLETGEKPALGVL